MNEWADFWRYTIGANVIPADTKDKVPLVKWTEFQDSPISKAQHDKWKVDCAFDKGMAVIAGKIWHNQLKNGLYLIFVDLDNQKAIDEFCTRNGKRVTLEEMSQHMLIEQHKDDLNRAHVYFYSKHPFLKKSSDRVSDLTERIDSNDIPAIEVKGSGKHGIAFCTSPHKNGYNYEIINIIEPSEISNLEQHIDSICRKYNISYLDQNGNSKSLVPIPELFKPETKIFEGHNRHEAVLRIIESLLSRTATILQEKTIKDLAWKENLRLCVPPLDHKEFEKQWNDGLSYVKKKRLEASHRNKAANNSNANTIIDLANNNIETLFSDQYGTQFGLIRISDHNEIMPLEGKKMHRFLAKLFYDNSNDIASTESINNATQVLQAKADFEGQTIPLYLRVAWFDNKNSIYYDLTNEQWNCVEITKMGWSIINDVPTIFVRYNQTTQVSPNRKYEQDIFDRFIRLTNVKDEHNKLLLKVYMISQFIPEIPHPILIPHGGKGSGKSTLLRLIKMICDPSRPELLTFHDDRTEFVQQLAHNYVNFYDNIRRIRSWMSDEVCKAVTGIGLTKRKLYTDDEDKVYDFKRCIGFNGINNCLTEPDALDRSILIELLPITRETRKTDEMIFSEFELLRPKLLAYIFDILVKVLKIKDSIKINDLPRMADFAIWGEAIARAIGYADLHFMNAYYANIGKQNMEALDAVPLAEAIQKMFSDEQVDFEFSWIAPPGNTLDRLYDIASRYKIKTDTMWPKGATALSRRLNEISANLLDGLGIEVKMERITKGSKKKNTSIIKIRKVTPLSPPLPPDEGQPQNEVRNSGDILTSGEIGFRPQVIHPPIQSQEQIQVATIIAQSGDSGHSGRTIDNQN
jgi:hypothetical protein